MNDFKCKQLLIGIVLLLAVSSHADDLKFRVNKVSGTKAIVEFSEAPVTLELGKTYSVAGKKTQSEESNSGREHLLSIQTSFNSLTKTQSGVSANSSTSVFGFVIGWNMINY